MYYSFLVCNEGYYSDEGSCTECALGSYKDSTGAAACTFCGGGDVLDPAQTTDEIGSTEASDCGEFVNIREKENHREH